MHMADVCQWGMQICPHLCGHYHRSLASKQHMKSPPRVSLHSMLCIGASSELPVMGHSFHKHWCRQRTAQSSGTSLCLKTLLGWVKWERKSGSLKQQLNKFSSEGALHGRGKSFLEVMCYLNKNSSTKGGLLLLVNGQRNPRSPFSNKSYW